MSDTKPNLLPIDANLSDQNVLTRLIGLIYEGPLELVPWSGILNWLRCRLPQVPHFVPGFGGVAASHTP